MIYAEPNHCPSTLISGSLLDLPDDQRHTSMIIPVLRLTSLSQVPQQCIFRSHLQSRPDTGSAPDTDPIQARQGQFTVRQGLCMILAFGFMASTSVLLFLSPIFLRDLSNVLFLVINCLFSHCRDQMERLEMFSLRRKNTVIGMAALDQGANVSNAYNTPLKKTGPTEQASPKVRCNLFSQENVPN